MTSSLVPSSVRTRLARQLDAAAWPQAGLSPLNRAIVWLILASVTLAILETEPAVHTGRETLFRAFGIAFAILFGIEYLARLWCAGENPRFRGLRGRLAFMVTPVALLDLAAVAALATPLLTSDAAALRLVRLLRILTLARLGRFGRAFAALGEAVRARRYELVASAAVAATLLLGTATLLYIVEGATQPEAFGSIPRAMWWSVATLTTVGYGDVFPVTGLGKLLAGATAVSGIGLIALPTGILASAFSEAIQKRREQEPRDGGE